MDERGGRPVGEWAMIACRKACSTRRESVAHARWSPVMPHSLLVPGILVQLEGQPLLLEVPSVLLEGPIVLLEVPSVLQEGPSVLQEGLPARVLLSVHCSRPMRANVLLSASSESGNSSSTVRSRAQSDPLNISRKRCAASNSTEPLR